MINGIVPSKDGFAVKDFGACVVKFSIGKPEFSSYKAAVNACRGKYYPDSYHAYLIQMEGVEKENLKICTWEAFNNMVYAGDPRGIWDGEREEWRDVSTMDKGAATEDEIDYLDALDATYRSLKAMAAQ